jgi:hypothetical protein
MRNQPPVENTGGLQSSEQASCQLHESGQGLCSQQQMEQQQGQGPELKSNQEQQVEQEQGQQQGKVASQQGAAAGAGGRTVGGAGSGAVLPEQGQGQGQATTPGDTPPSGGSGIGGVVLGQDDWSARRLGVQMAQLLRDVKVPKS